MTTVDYHGQFYCCINNCKNIAYTYTKLSFMGCPVSCSYRPLVDSQFQMMNLWIDLHVMCPIMLTHDPISWSIVMVNNFRCYVNKYRYVLNNIFGHMLLKSNNYADLCYKLPLLQTVQSTINDKTLYFNLLPLAYYHHNIYYITVYYLLLLHIKKLPQAPVQSPHLALLPLQSALRQQKQPLNINMTHTMHKKEFCKFLEVGKHTV